jgi:hypothetical protein
MLHFKFLSDFHDRVVTKVARREHYASAREYRAYFDLQEKGTVGFFTKDSVRFQDSAQFVGLGLMRSEPAFENSVRLTQAARAPQQAAGGA